MAKAVVTFDPKLLEAMRAAAPLNLEKATELADMFDVKVKSVIAKATREKIPYQKKVAVRKDGKAIASKEATVGKIEQAFDLEVGALEGLEKASKVALETVLAQIEAHIGSTDVEVE